MKTSNLFWKEIQVGQFIEESMDMGYLDGKLISNDSKSAKSFLDIVSKLEVMSVMENPQNGIRATLKDETNFSMNVLVLGITEKMELSLKMIVGKQETIDWYLTNVPEEKLLTTTYKNNGGNSAETKNSNNNKIWSKLKSLWS